MSQPITSRDVDRWLDLIAQAIRLTNPKVSDLGPLKKTGRTASKAIFPEEFQGVRDNPFMRLVKGAEQLERGAELDKQLLITLSWTCLEKLLGTDLGVVSRDALRIEALRSYQTFRQVIGNLCFSS